MSQPQIVSPHPPIRISITIDRQSGVANMQLSEKLTTEMTAQTLVALALDTVTDRIRQLEELGLLTGVKYSNPEIPSEIPLKALLTLCLTMIQDRMKVQMNTIPKPDENPFTSLGLKSNGA